MAILRTAQSASWDEATGGTVQPVLTGFSAGDVVISIALELRGSQTVGTPAGNTAIDNNASGQVRAFAFVSVDGTETLPSFTWGSGSIAAAYAVAYSGVDPGLIPAFSSGTRSYNQTQNMIGPASALTPNRDGSLVLLIGELNKTSTTNGKAIQSVPSNFTLITPVLASNGAKPSAAIAEWIQTTASPINANSVISWDAADSTQSGQSILISLIPALGTPPPGESCQDLPPTARPGYKTHQQQFWSVPETITSLPPPDLPPAVDDFTMPGRSPRSPELYSVPTNTLPLGTDRVLQPALWDYEWDKPSLPVALRAECIGFTALELFSTTNFPPYRETNWPVPLGPRQFLRDFQSSFNKNLIGQDSMPPGGPQKNLWPVPRGPSRPVEGLSCLSSGLSLYYFIPPKPVGGQSLDLPPPPARRLREDYIQGLDASVLTFLSTLPPFLPCTDLPPFRPRRLMSLSYDYNGSLLYLKLNTIPVGQSTQFNPRLARRARSSSLYEIVQYAPLNPPSPPPGPPASSGQVAGPGGRIIFMPKKVGETVIRPFDFISRLGAGERILSAVTTASVYSGNDSNPSAIINGGAAISGTIVNQSLTGGLLGVIYELLCTITTSLGQRLEMSAFWVVEPDLP